MLNKKLFSPIQIILFLVLIVVIHQFVLGTFLRGACDRKAIETSKITEKFEERYKEFGKFSSYEASYLGCLNKALLFDTRGLFAEKWEITSINLPEGQNVFVSISPVLSPTAVPTITPMKTNSEKIVPTVPLVNTVTIRQSCSEKTQRYIDEKITGKKYNVVSATSMINANYSLCVTSMGLPPENLFNSGEGSLQN